MRKSQFDVSIMLLLVLCGLVSYAGTFDASFQMDDELSIVSNRDIHLEELSWKGLMKAGFPGHAAPIPVRPVALASFALNFYFGGLNVSGYHLVNIFIHVLTGIGVYLLARLILYSNPTSTSFSDGRRDEFSERQRDVISALAAFLWLLSPVQTQAVTYIVQRMTSMATLFFVWAFITYIKGRRTDKTWTKRIYFTLTLILFLFALGAKQTGLVFPLMVMAYEACFYRGADWKKILLWSAFAVLLLAAGILYVFRIEDISTDLLLKTDYAMKERVFTEARVIIFYTVLLLFPIPSKMALIHDFPFSRGLLYPPETLIAIIFVGGAIAFSLYRCRRDPPLSFLTLWYFMPILAESLYPAIYPVYEHRLYLPSVGFFAAVAVLLARLWYVLEKRRKSYLVFAGIFVCLIFSVNTYCRNNDWHDPVSLWADNAEKSPNIPKPYEALGIAYLMMGELDKAETELHKAVRLDPLSNANIGIGTIYYLRGDHEQAFKQFNYAVRSRSLGLGVRHIDAPLFFYKMGEDLLKAGKRQDALRILNLGLRFDPDNREIREAIAKVEGR